MKVRMLVTTSWKGGKHYADEIVDVPEEVAFRWIRNRIAEDLPDSPEVAEKAATNDQITKTRKRKG